MNNNYELTPIGVQKFLLLKNRLLDLGNQNRQLYFQPNHKDTVKIFHPQMNTLFKIIVELGQTCTFPVFLKKKKRQNKKSSSSSNSSNEDTEERSEENESSDQSLKELLEQNQGKFALTEIISYFDDDTLRSRLKTIQDKAQELEDEKGIDSLFLIFGILEWYDPSQKIKISSPLLFLPIKLHCESPQSNYELNAVSEEVIVNPHLREKLRTSHRIDLPTFDEVVQMYSLRKFFEQVKNLIPKDWIINEECYISLFSGSKITLFNDIEAYPQKYTQHSIIRAIMEDKGYSEQPENNPQDSWISDQANPWENFTIVDCDSSQMEAVMYAKSGASLVIQGPPGTGKSQCISNIIAECLGNGKKILFVAEKKAAVEFVKKRLEKCGLGEFCMEIHAAAPKKTEIMEQFGRTINLEYNPPSVRSQKHIELRLVRNRINEYVECINRPLGQARYSIFEMMGRDLQLNHIPLLNSSFPDPYNFTEEQIVKIEDQLSRLQVYQLTLLNYDNHPWASANVPIYQDGIKEYLKQNLNDFIILNKNFEIKIKLIDEKLQTIGNIIEDNHPQRNHEKAQYWKEIIPLWPVWIEYRKTFQILQPIFNFQDPSKNFESFDYFHQILHLNSQSESINSLIQKMERYIVLLPQLEDKLLQFQNHFGLHPIESKQDLSVYTEFLSEYNSKALIIDTSRYLQLFQEKYHMMFQRLGGSYHKDKADIMLCIRSSAPNREIIDHLYRIQEFQSFFGNLKSNTQIEEFDFYITQIQIIYNEIEDLLVQIQPIFNTPKINLRLTLKNSSGSSIWKNFEEETQGWIAHLDQLNEWIEVQKIYFALKENGLEDYFRSLTNKNFQPYTYRDLFIKLYTRHFLSKSIISNPQIENFNADHHEQSINQFQQLDEEILLLNRERLRQVLFSRRPISQLQIDQKLLSQIGFLKREAKKKNKMKSLRDVFSYSQDFISLLTPCLMMSPLSVANFLDLEKYNQYFDVVIFDEASQVTTEDALGAIVRGKQLIVVGDSQQLPPSQFFATKVEDEFGSIEIQGETMESLLEECTGIGLREKLLRYHYRSRREGLISFSNTYFYDNRLFTFPDLENNTQKNIDPSRSAVEFCYQANGIYENRRNLTEAEAVANAILDHYEKNQMNNTHYSLGVVAFSQSQQETIIKELEQLSRKYPDKEQLMRESTTEPLFIKNLENVQGDERDFMIISVGYGRNPTGSIGLHFGPINQAGGYRRLNVIITRARLKVKIFCSFLPSEINPDKVQAEGLKRLLNYLEFARTGKIPIQSRQNQMLTESQYQDLSFKSHVKKVLENSGFSVIENVGQSTFKIDLALVHPQDPTRFIIGIICDGGSYASAPNARDRDRIRPQVLGGLGWILYHLWSPIWYAQYEKIVQEIKSLVSYSIKEVIQPQIKKEIETSYAPFTIKTSSDNIDVSADGQSAVGQDDTFLSPITPTYSIFSEGIEREQYLKWAGISQYQLFIPTHPISQGVFFAEDNTALVDAVRKILQIEGPIHIELFQKRIFQLFDFKRVSPRINEKLNELFQKFIVDKDFIGLSTQTNPGIRICVNSDDPRDFFQIHPLELQNAMILLLTKFDRLKKADLFKSTLALFGIGIVRKNYVAHLEELLEHLVNQHEIQNVGNFYSIK